MNYIRIEIINGIGSFFNMISLNVKEEDLWLNI